MENERMGAMYRVLQMVVYGVHGVCRILELETKTVDHKLVDYYVLEPLAQPGTRYYIPSQNSAAMAKIRPLTERGRLEEMIRGDAQEAAWIPDENQRKQHYRRILASVDAGDLISMVRCVETHRQTRAQIGRKLHLCDENFLRDAKRVLTSEIAQVLQIEEKEVASLFTASVSQ